METVVELLDVNGEWWNLTDGNRGVYLGTDPKGLYDPPVKVVYEEPGNYPGARYLNHRILRRDIVFGVEILGDEGIDSWVSRDSEWRKAWAFDRDCKLYVTTDSGTRYLKLRLGESIEVELYHGPDGKRWNRAGMICISGDVFWYEDDVIYSAVTEDDTTFDPNPLPWPWPQEELPTETLTITVDPADGKGGLNPTDQPVFLKWTLPGSTEKPASPYIPGIPWLGAPNSPATVWTVPDYSFTDEELANRRLRMPGLIGGLRTQEVQKIYIDGRPTGGTFTLGFGAETTGTIAYNASAGTVESALIALAGITAGDVSVVQEAATNEVQTVRLTGGATGGTFTLSFDGQTTAGIPYNASNTQIASALAALSNVGYLDISVTQVVSSESQRVELIGEPTGGTFTLTLDGQTTSAIPYNATTLQVATALTALSNVGPFDVLVTGESLFLWGPFNITFINGLAGVNVNQMTGNGAGLTGGAGAGVNITTETGGDRLYEVTFRSALGGLNLPQMTGSAASLTGGVSPAVQVVTTVDGARPYVVTFLDDLEGLDVPKMTINTASLTGGAGVAGTVKVVTEGFTYPAENAVVDTDPRVEQVSAESVSPLWSRMNGVRFRHPVPAYTRSKTFEITVSGAIPGQMITLRIPRPWTRPWGLE